ncbi:DnaD domain protein [Wansuia hejianensis]|uniref:DnaD domain protein n=1 Tax=Wansuia hejianensis TaxID=2763667 RepID=A0A926IMI0_9FIRM|nr:DnaD domain protein [Wansuia hejianensis]MBC8590641.1 DnaD domain protein [Wansuia hejianensis]
MNYIREINAFYDLVQLKQLSTGQIALWHALMQINNKCAWIEWFNVPNLTLELTSGLSRKGIYNARNILKQHGIIDFKTNGKKATSYKLISLQHITHDSTQDSTQGKNLLQDITQGTTQGTTHSTTQDTTQDSATLNKLNETKLKETITSSVSQEDVSLIVNQFQQNGFGTINFTVKESLLELLEVYPVEWIVGAMKVAVESNKRSLRYVRGILENWNRSGGMKLGGREDGTGNYEYKPDATKAYGFTEEDAERAGVTSL